LKEQLKSQIAKQHQPFSNPNQPSSSIEVDDL
jgi:dual specificity tyrosine-phosphorylation-regulated kinase 2/3/4